MTSISDFLKITGNEFASVAQDGVTAGDISGWVDSGSYAFNALLSGDIYKGFPGNKIVVLGADPSTGKTFFALGAAKNFLDQNPDGIVICFESESAITKDMLVERGIDVRRFGVVPVSTVQQFKTQALRIVDNYEKEPKKDRKPILFILDSLGMLSTDKEMADSVEGKDTRDMTRAQLIKAAFRVLTLKLGRAGIPMIVTNHVYEDVGGGPYASKVQAGGSGAIYASSTILTLSKAKERDTATNEVTGVIVTVTATKSRFTRENSKIKCLIRYDGGLDRYHGLLELAEEAGVFKKVSTRYELEDGTKLFGKTIMENPEKYFTDNVLERINEYVKRKFCYGSGYDQDGIDEDFANKEDQGSVHES
jgi:RecA/RadA recombinase